MEDTASRNIHRNLLDIGDFEKVGEFQDMDVHFGHGFYLYQIKGLHLYLDGVDEAIRSHFEDELIEDQGISGGSKYPLDLLVFLSKHRSEMKLNSLTVHPPGNYISADHGGELGFLPPSSPRYMSSALRVLHKKKKELGIKDQTTYEVTHHGPKVNSPCFFIEIGSDETRWEIGSLGEAIARTLLSDGFHNNDEEIPIAIGIGGGHYAPRFTDRAMRKKFDFGHMVPDYILKGCDSIKDVIGKAWKSTPGAEGAFIHRSKSNSQLQEEIMRSLKDLGIEELTI
jgi:D-aminoacyl-tRNA deacylase